MPERAAESVSLVWLRRDLRLYDHIPLALAMAERGAVQLCFVFDTDILSRFNSPTDRRLTFLARTLCRLNEELHSKGGELLVFKGRAVDIVPRLVTALRARQVFAGKDYEPETIQRDEAVARQLKQRDVAFVQPCDHLLLRPDSIVKSDGTPYKVFTPFARKWRETIAELHFRDFSFDDRQRYTRPDMIRPLLRDCDLAALDLAAGPDQLLKQIEYEPADIDEWQVEDAQRRLSDFAARKAAAYPQQRDLLAEDGTSKLSPFLRFGLLSIRDAYRRVLAAAGDGAWINELIWREFYAMILYRFPSSASEEFQERYRGLPWRRSPELFRRFSEGRTGYPIVDAAIRQLLSTGWMHNRARMIVASFCCKDLMLDWRLGEEFFARYLMDYELASNVGGWQWAASTGTDAAPYFRIFNPYLQSNKFDPAGEYIRRYVPELAHLQSPAVHQGTGEGLFAVPDYPTPIVDRRETKARVLAVFKQTSADAESSSTLKA